MTTDVHDLVSFGWATLPKGQLAQMLVDGIVGWNGHTYANAGPVSQVMKWRKDEIVNDIRDIIERSAPA